MKNAPRFFRSALIGSLCLIGAFIAAASLFTYLRLSRDLQNRSRRVLQDRVVLIHESISSAIDEAAGRLHSVMSFMQKEALSQDSYRTAVEDLNSSLPGCRRIWIVRDEENTFFDAGTSREYLEGREWWKPLREQLAPASPSRAPARFEIAVVPGRPYRDGLDLNTILPIAFRLLSGTDVVSLAFVEIDLTAVLMDKINDFHLDLSERNYPFAFTVYDRRGALLETSENIPVQSVPILRSSQVDLTVPYGDDRFLTGAVFVPRGDTIAVFTRDSELGLIFGGSLPRAAVTSGATRAAGYILGIGVFCILAVLGLGLLLLRTYHKMKLYEAEQATARFQSLQNKMDPHFLFNTLDSLVGVAEKQDYPTLMGMLKSLSFILHMNLRIRGDVVPLRDEIRYIHSYIGLQRIRYRDQFSFETALPPDLEDLEVLRFCLQPLVENCFVHAVALRKGYIHIRMDLSRDGGRLCCDIRNDGPAVPPAVRRELREKLASEWRNVKAPRLGLMSIHRRLRMLYGEAYGLVLPDAPTGFHVRVLLPALL